MNKTAAVICEYNPFHLGHLRQIRLTREAFGADATVLALMSGNFVQRGEAAMYSKYDRARAALACGADLVLELPFPYCAGGASYFAAGAVSILDRLGCVDDLVFGTEEMTGDQLRVYAENCRSDTFVRALGQAKDVRDGSLSDIRLAQQCYAALFGERYPEKANDILAAEYLTALWARGSRISPFALHREGEWSATAIRRSLREGDRSGDGMPPAAWEILRDCRSPLAERMSGAVLSHYRLADPSALAAFEGCGGGVADRLCRAARESSDLDGMLEKARCKTLTDAAIRRAVWCGMLGVRREDLRREPGYTTVLAASEAGKELLCRIRRTSAIPVFTKPSDALASPSCRAAAAMSARADALYELFLGLEAGDQLRRSPSLQ